MDQLKKEENEENKNFEKNNFKFNTEDKLMSKKPLQYNKRLSGKKVKIADFGLAREIRSIPPFHRICQYKILSCTWVYIAKSKL